MAKKPKTRGPDPERLALPGEWRDAMGKALKKKRPKEGWPEPTKKHDKEQ